MNKDEILNSITEIGKCEDLTERLSMLTNLHDSVGKVFDDLELEKQNNTNLNETLAKKEEELTTAQEYNMKMYLRLSEDKSKAEVQKEETGIKEEKVVTKSFDELKKGYIK